MEYETPEIVFEGTLEVHAGSPLGITNPLSIDDLGL